jgi:hypothetical protein
MCTSNRNRQFQLSSSSLTGENICTFTVPTFKEQRFTTTINTKDLESTSDLAMLKKNDPFMFHSIPEVRKAVIKGEDVNLSTLSASDHHSRSSIVERKSVISFESWDFDFELLLDDKVELPPKKTNSTQKGRRQTIILSFLRDLTNTRTEQID